MADIHPTFKEILDEHFPTPQRVRKARASVDHEAIWQEALDEIWERFAAGDYQDELEGLFARGDYELLDLLKVTLHHLYPHLFSEPRCSVKDLKNSFGWFLEKYAEELYQEKLP